MPEGDLDQKSDVLDDVEMRRGTDEERRARFGMGYRELPVKGFLGERMGEKRDV